jgi:hypothetical protein
MAMGTMEACDEYSRHVGLIKQRYGAKLRRNFLSQLGDASEAEACWQETLRYFLLFMEDHCWEPDEKLTRVYLLRLAGAVCSRRLAEKRLRCASGCGRWEGESALDKIVRELIQLARWRVEFKQLFLKIFGSVRQPRLKQLAALR